MLMARSENQKLKLLYIVKILMEETDMEHPMSMQTLIDKLAANNIKAERKSIYNDISYLKEFDINIEYNNQHKNGGYYIADRTFELPECKLLVDAVSASRFITAAKSQELIKKIEGLVSKYDAVHLQRQVYTMERVKSQNSGIYYRIDDIHKAIRQNNRISFQYLEWNLEKKLVPRRNGKKYIISPWALMWNDENYYLIGYDSEDEMIKHFRVDKIGPVKLLEEAKREGENAFKKCDLSMYSSKTFGMYGGEEEIVTIQFPNELVGVVLDRFGKEVSLQRKSDKEFAIHVKVAVSGQFFGWLAGIGKHAKLIAPESVKHAYKEYLREIIEG